MVAIDNDKAQKLNEFWSKMEVYQRNSWNSAAYQFSSRALKVIADAYQAKFENGKRSGEWIARNGVDTSTADKLVGMGATEAVFGAGRNLLIK